jgi:cell division protein FtsL
MKTPLMPNAPSLKPRRPIGRRPTHEGRRTFWLAVSVASVLALLGVAHTWTRVAVLERKYDIASKQAENQQLTSQLEKLKLEVATYESEKRVDEAARSLAMAKPAQGQVIVVRDVLAQDNRAVPAKSALAVNER